MAIVQGNGLIPVALPRHAQPATLSATRPAERRNEPKVGLANAAKEAKGFCGERSELQARFSA
jgi:hypothetical protein